MASTGPPTTRARRALEATSSSDKLPADVLFLVPQQLRAKELCRLRTVCRSWRALTSTQAFIREHADRHKEPLFLVKFRDDDETHVHVVDLSGKVVKRIAGTANGGLQILHTRLNLACLATERNTCRVLNPATGGIRQVPPLVDNPVILQTVCTFFALGMVAGTGEYKLLRILITSKYSGVEVLTINGGADHAQWRQRPGHRLSIDARSGVVVDGVVHFLTKIEYIVLPFGGSVPLDDFDGMPADYIVSFDLAREEWRRGLPGPSSTAGNITSGQMLRSQLTLADLKGSLVLAHHHRSPSVMDLWFLLDFESGLWVKQYNIRTDSVSPSLEARYRLTPLLALDDGRLVIHLAPAGLLFICDPGTNTFTQVDMRLLDSIAVYTGSLLSLQEGHMV